MKPFCHFEKLIHPFLSHDSSKIQEMNFIILRIRLQGIIVQINASSVKYNFFVFFDNLSFTEFFCICLIFEKDCFDFSERRFIQHRNKSCQLWILKCGSHPLHIGEERYFQHSTHEPGINVWFNRIGKNDIRFFIPDHLKVAFDKRQIFYRIHPPALHIGLNAFHTHGFEIFFVSHKRHADDDLVFFHQFSNQLSPELPEHIRMIRHN